MRRAASMAALLLTACAAPPAAAPTATPVPEATLEPQVTPLPTREAHAPGELVDYTAQSGDWLPAVAARFSTDAEAILAANPGLNSAESTLPPGLQLQIPAFHLPFVGGPFKILPDSEVVNGPSASGFDILQEMQSRSGFVSDLSDYAYRLDRPAWEVVESIAINYSIHPRLLLTLLEHQTSALTEPAASGEDQRYPLGHRDTQYRGLFRQLLWASELINEGYYGWRLGTFREFETADAMIYRPDAWQNAGSVAVQRLFAALYSEDELEWHLGPDGFAATYRELWGDPFAKEIELIPDGLQQPELVLPFVPNRIWDFTGGPHSSWGTSLPLGALDFAPPAMESGCAPSGEWVASPAAGTVTRSEEAIVVVDLDGDNDSRTGWSLFFYHVGEEGRIAVNTPVRVGDTLGHPSCEGGRATGTHFHMARRYNGEWMDSEGPVPFVLDGWVAAAGDVPYEGTLTRDSNVVPACTCSAAENRIIYQPPGS